jgi:hypothetical protein
MKKKKRDRYYLMPFEEAKNTVNIRSIVSQGERFLYQRIGDALYIYPYKKEKYAFSIVYEDDFDTEGFVRLNGVSFHKIFFKKIPSGKTLYKLLTSTQLLTRPYVYMDDFGDIRSNIGRDVYTRLMDQITPRYFLFEKPSKILDNGINSTRLNLGGPSYTIYSWMCEEVPPAKDLPVDLKEKSLFVKFLKDNDVYEEFLSELESLSKNKKANLGKVIRVNWPDKIFSGSLKEKFDNRWASFESSWIDTYNTLIE